MVNVWKISTLALAGALALVVTQGAVRESTACDLEDVADRQEQETQLRLSSALSLLDRAEAQVIAARNARPLPRAKALEGIALAKAQVERGLEPREQPRPRPRPMRGAKEVASF